MYSAVYSNVQPSELICMGTTTSCAMHQDSNQSVHCHTRTLYRTRKCTYLQLLLPLYGKWIINLLDAICEGLLLLVDKLGVIKARNVAIDLLVSIGKVARPQLGELEGNIWRSCRLASRLCAHADRSLIQKLPDLLVRKFLIGVILEERLMRWQQLHIGVVGGDAQRV
jgi:hypothetical protein